ncbi:MAG: hypothetical protein IIA10_02990 [Proteobacteria bacterium]|nr:hypothetical protein [Pseudomonadota bacterium]
MKPADLLVEIGTEELPPEALRGLMDAFADLFGDLESVSELEAVFFAAPDGKLVAARERDYQAWTTWWERWTAFASVVPWPPPFSKHRATTWAPRRLKRTG